MRTEEINFPANYLPDVPDERFGCMELDDIRQVLLASGRDDAGGNRHAR